MVTIIQFLISLLSILHATSVYPFSITPTPVFEVYNHHKDFGRISAIDFHPQGERFALTYRANGVVAIYTLLANNLSHLHQILHSTDPRISMPHGLAYHPRGTYLAVSYYVNDTPNCALVVYKYSQEQDKFLEQPLSVYVPPAHLKVWAPHGVAFSPHGNCLAVTYCDAHKTLGYEEKIVLYAFDEETGTLVPEPLSVVIPPTAESNPKGITFSPDGTHVIVTLCGKDSLAVYSFDKATNTMGTVPKQIIKNPEARLSRPEDAAFSLDGKFIAITNSTKAQVTVYGWSTEQGAIVPEYPLYTLKNPEARLYFPHGIAFAPKGSYLAVTHYGIAVDPHVQQPSKREDKVTFYKVE